MSRRLRDGLNWKIISNAALAVSAVLLIWTLVPFGQCLFRTFQDADLEELAQSQDFSTAGERGSRADSVLSGDGFFGKIGGSAVRCQRRNPIQMAPLWQLMLIAVSFVVGIAARILSGIQYKRMIRDAASMQRQARKSLRKERLSRGDSSASFAAVDDDTDRFGTDDRERPVSRNLRGEDSRDVLSALDDLDMDLDPEDIAFAQTGAPSDLGQDRTAAPAAKSAPSKPNTLAGLGWDDDALSDTMAPAIGTRSEPAPRMSPPAATGSTEPATSPAPAPPAGGSGNVIQSAVARARAGLADTDIPDAMFAGDTAIGDETAAPSIAQRAPAAATIHQIDFGDSVSIGAELVLHVRGSDLSRSTLQSGMIRLGAMRGGQKIVLWPEPKSAARSGQLEAPTARHAKLRIPWAQVSPQLAEATRSGGFEGLELTATFELSDRRFETSIPFTDSLSIGLDDRHGRPVEADVLRVVSVDGHVRRMRVGASVAGVGSLHGLEPGTYRVEAEDGSFLELAGGRRAPFIELSTMGLAYADQLGGVDSEARHRVIRTTAARVFVSASAEPSLANGTREFPFVRIQQALEFVAERRASSDRSVRDEFEVAELRVVPSPRLPANRIGLLVDANGECEWLKWWKCLPVDTGIAWTSDISAQAIRETSLYPPGTMLREELLLEGARRIRIVNAGYADLRERFAMNDRVEVSIDAEYGDLAMAVVAGAEGDPGAPYRVELRNCEDVWVEGFHFLGRSGQSGLHVSDSERVTFVRCWFDLYESSSTPIRGVVPAGRGAQVERSGRKSADHVVAFERCEFAHNTSVRRGIPIAGSGLAVFDSHVRLANSYFHHNRAGQEPVAILVSGDSRLTGTGNHRDRNDLIGRR